MLTSVLDIVDVEGNLSGDEMRVGGFDLIYKNNAMVGSINNPASNYSTMLGADIPAEPRTCASGARGADDHPNLRESPLSFSLYLR